MSSHPLCDLVGLDEAGRSTRLDFFKIDAPVERTLAGLGEFLESEADGMADAFYEHLLAFEGTAAHLSDPELLKRLRAAQRRHLIGYGAATRNADYFESRLRVGMVHAHINLEPHWYIGACNFQLSYMQRRILAVGTEVVERTEAITKAMMLDIDLAITAYIYGGFVERSLAQAYERESERSIALLAERDDAERRKENLLRMVVHDIRSPVAAMISTARLGLRRAPDTDTPPGKQFALVQDSGENVMRIIDDMLAVAESEETVLKVNAAPCDVASIVRAVTVELGAFARQAQHALDYDGIAALHAENLDPDLVRRIASNLVMNAVRHTPTGTAVTATVAKGEESCAIEVADNGPGIPPSVIERLEREAEAPSRAAGRLRATGLGLSFCRLAADRLGGRFEALRPAKGGTLVRVELPLTT